MIRSEDHMVFIHFKPPSMRPTTKYQVSCSFSGGFWFYLNVNKMFAVIFYVQA